MSDFPNGRPPGQNNIDAGSPPYVDPANDPSATAQKPDAERGDEDGIEVREDDTDHEVQQELKQAAGNYVDPSEAPPPPKKEEKVQTAAGPGKSATSTTQNKS